MADNYFTVTNEDFAEKVLQAANLVVVNFSAQQSNACKIQDPEFEAVSSEYQQRVTFVRFDVTGQEEITRQWNVEGIPTLIFFKGGNEIYRISGVVMRARLRRQIEGILLAD